MSWRASASLTIITFAVSSVLLAQRVLVQLGLTDATARNFLLNEIKHPASSRRDTIVVTGNRAFLKLPPAARAQAASSLFAWIKGYVNSPTFKSAYSTYRKGVVGEPLSLGFSSWSWLYCNLRAQQKFKI
jgi:hypothetical protein